MSKFGAPMEDDHEDGHKPIKHNEVKPPRELVPAPEGEEEPSPDPGSNGRSMKIKIKISPPAPPQPLPEPNNSKETRFSQTCCGKLFSSGKAWGGHKRHHALKESEPQLQPRTNKFEDVEKKKKKVGVIKAGDVKVSNGGKPECCLCGKNFPSMNSLFGHMRFHRDRGKGLNHQPSTPLLALALNLVVLVLVCSQPALVTLRMIPRGFEMMVVLARMGGSLELT